MEPARRDHLTEEELILHFYGESPDPAEVAKHLEICDSCAQQYENLDRMLSVIAETPVPWRPARYGEQVWKALQPQITPRRAVFWPLNRPGKQWHIPRLAWATLATLLVVGGFLLGRLSLQSPTEPAAQIARKGSPAAIASGGDPERVWVSEIGRHLERSQLALIELIHSKTNGVVDISLEQILAQELLAVNRLYRHAARTTGDKPLSRLLERLELVLIEVANAPAELSREEFALLRERIDSEGLLFEVKVIAAQFRAREEKNEKRVARS